jgi:hypothetical protein
MDMITDDVYYSAIDNYPDQDDREMNGEPQHDDRISMSLHQFCRRAKDLLSLDQTAFVCFLLTGQDTDGSQACIDPIINRVTRHSRLHINRDYDSLLGISSDILINTYATIYPISKLQDTLSRNIHIRYEFTTANVSFVIVG